ncbi:MAG TPA: RDD family protein [Candidatus Angelobacter sp.]
MTCPICGKVSPCVHARRNTSVLVDHQADHEPFTGDEAAPFPQLAMGGRPGNAQAAARPAVDEAWRQEVVSRVQQHRARRRKPADPNAPELDFSAEKPYSFGAEPQEYSAIPPPPERFHEIVIPQNKVKRNPLKQNAARQEMSKVIRFPRTQPEYVPTVEEVMLDELEIAEPAPEIPRILEASEAVPEEACEEMYEPAYEPVYEPEPECSPQPQQVTFPLEAEQMELLPNFSDIHLEPEEARISNLEIIPRPAPLNQRFLSGVVDAGIVFAATTAFILTFLGCAEEMPQSRMAVVCLFASGGIFWLLFQYIFLTYRRATPGMRMAQLEVCTFEGMETIMFERQIRAAASALSGFSMGLGYAWALVDEDRLGWHDRISKTHLREALGHQHSELSQREIYR